MKTLYGEIPKEAVERFIFQNAKVNHPITYKRFLRDLKKRVYPALSKTERTILKEAEAGQDHLPRVIGGKTFPSV